MAYGNAERDPENVGEFLLTLRFDKYGVEAPVHVNDVGVFSTQIAGEDFAAWELSGLKGQAHTFLFSAQKQVPFVHAASGSRGTIRAVHKTTRDLLVTWANGSKGKLDTYTKVLPGDTPDHVRQTIIDADKALEAAKLRYADVQRNVGGVSAEDFFTKAVGADLLSHQSNVAELDPDGAPVVV